MQIDPTSLLTVLGSAGSTGLTLWAFSREFKKEKRATLESYATTQVKAEGHRRDIEHLKKDLEQISSNVAHLDGEYESRFRHLEAELGRLAGALEVLMVREPG